MKWRFASICWLWKGRSWHTVSLYVMSIRFRRLQACVVIALCGSLSSFTFFVLNLNLYGSKYGIHTRDNFISRPTKPECCRYGTICMQNLRTRLCPTQQDTASRHFCNFKLTQGTVAKNAISRTHWIQNADLISFSFFQKNIFYKIERDGMKDVEMN